MWTFILVMIGGCLYVYAFFIKYGDTFSSVLYFVCLSIFLYLFSFVFYLIYANADVISVMKAGCLYIYIYFSYIWHVTKKPI